MSVGLIDLYYLLSFADKRFRLMVSTLPFCGLSICLSHSCIVLKRQKISTRFLLHTTATCLAQIALKSGLHRSTASSTNFDSPPVNLSIVDNRRRIRRKRPSLFQMIAYYHLPPTTSPFPKMGVPNVPSRTNFTTRAATWRI